MTREDPRSVIDFLDDTDDEMPELIYGDDGRWYDDMPVLGVSYEPPFSFSRVLLLQYGGYYIRVRVRVTLTLTLLVFARAAFAIRGLLY